MSKPEIGRRENVTPRHVLCLVDDSKGAQVALEHGYELAQRWRARLILASFVPPVAAMASLAGLSTEELVSSLERHADARLLDALYAAPADVEALVIRRTGRQSLGLLRLAFELKPDLLVLGTEKRRRPWLTGRLSAPIRAGLATYGRCSVLVVAA